MNIIDGDLPQFPEPTRRAPRPLLDHDGTGGAA